MDPKIKKNFLTLLSLLKTRAENQLAQLEDNKKSNFNPQISTAIVVGMMRKSGVAFNYSTLTQLMQDPTVQSLISDVNRESLTLNVENDQTSVEEPIPTPADQLPKPQASPESPVATSRPEPTGEPQFDEQSKDVVKQMAARAARKRRA